MARKGEIYNNEQRKDYRPQRKTVAWWWTAV